MTRVFGLVNCGLLYQHNVWLGKFTFEKPKEVMRITRVTDTDTVLYIKLL